MNPTIKVTAYFSASIRGEKGSNATPTEINQNIKTGKKTASKICRFFGGLLDMYVPHNQDELIQILWRAGKLTIWDILDGDCQLVAERDIFLAWAPKGFMSAGMIKEKKAAEEKGIPIVQFEKFDDKTALTILELIYQIVMKKKEEL